MKQIHTNLFVGGLDDITEFEKLITTKVGLGKLSTPSSDESFYIVHAAKEPFHRKALGYTGNGAPKEHPEYLVAKRRQRLILNLVDVPEDKAQYIPDACLEAGIEYIRWALQEQRKPVFIHCNEGQSRAPSIALMYLIKHTEFFEQCDTFEEVELFYKAIYPDYNPNGIRVKTKTLWEQCNPHLIEKEVKDD